MPRKHALRGVTPYLRLAAFIGIPYPLGVALGWWVAVKLMALPVLPIFKVLNIAGVAFDLTGVLLLSRLVSKSTRYQKFVCDWLSSVLGFLMAGVSMGMLACAEERPTGPFAAVVHGIASASLGLVALPAMVVIANLVANEDNVLGLTLDQRLNLLGGFFILSGLTLQLIAAVLDLYA